ASRHVARDVALDRGGGGRVLARAGRHRRAADAAPEGDAGVLRFAPREGLEHELVALQHVGVDRRERRAEVSDALAREPEQVLAGDIVQMRGAERADDRARLEVRGQVPGLVRGMRLYLSLARLRRKRPRVDTP